MKIIIIVIIYRGTNAKKFLTVKKLEILKATNIKKC